MAQANAGTKIKVSFEQKARVNADMRLFEICDFLSSRD